MRIEIEKIESPKLSSHSDFGLLYKFSNHGVGGALLSISNML
jgi:hypothetical protein